MTTTEGIAIGQQFAQALAAKRWDEVAAALHPDVVFRGMTPGRFWEAETAAEVVVDVLQQWFEANDHIEQLTGVDTAPVADRFILRYGLRVRNRDGLHAVAQQGYYDVDADGRIVRLHLMCAGYRPLPD